MPDEKEPIRGFKHLSPVKKRGNIRLEVYGEETGVPGLRTVSMTLRV
jgi:hypothetical protein